MMVVQSVWAQNYENHWATKSLDTWEDMGFMSKDVDKKKDTFCRDTCILFVVLRFPHYSYFMS